MALILLAAFGPVLWLVPSANDRRLTRIRGRARALGMQVEMVQLPDPMPSPQSRVSAGGERRTPMISCALYRQTSRRPLRRAPAWRILRVDQTINPNGPLAGWQWDEPAAGDAAYWAGVIPIIAALPADALGAATDAMGSACWWRERSDARAPEEAVNRLSEQLSKLNEIQQLIDDKLRETEID